MRCYRAGFRAEKPGHFARILNAWGEKAKLDGNGNYPNENWLLPGSTICLRQLFLLCKLVLSCIFLPVQPRQTRIYRFSIPDQHNYSDEVPAADMGCAGRVSFCYILVYPDEVNFIL